MQGEASRLPFFFAEHPFPMDGEQTAPEIRALPACLVTWRLLLRQPTERDVPVIVREIGNFKVSRWLGQVPYPYAPLHARQWLAVQRRRRADGRDLTFVIARRQKPDIVIGGIGSHGVGTLHPTVGYWLGERYWGKGYGREALTALLAALFEIAPGSVPVATALAGNAGSIALLRGAGFRREPGRVYLTSRSRRRKVQVLRFTYAPPIADRNVLDTAPAP